VGRALDRAGQRQSVPDVQGSDGITASFASPGDVATAPVAGSPYAISATLSDPNGKLGNYAVHTTDAVLTVSKANPTVTILPYNVTYDGTRHTATGSVTGAFGETLSGLDLSGTTHTNAGNYAGSWTFTDATDNYNNTSAPVDDSIGKAPLTVNVANDLMLLGSNPPALSGTVAGSVGGDTVAVTYATAATAKSSVGAYPITATVSGNLANYQLTVNPGLLFVVTIGADPDGTGTKNISFWDNSGDSYLVNLSDLTNLDALNLVNNAGSAFDPATFAQLQTWLKNASSSANEAYWLSARLASLELSVLTNYVQATDVVDAAKLLPFSTATSPIVGLDGGGFITIGNLIAAANAALLANPVALKGSAAWSLDEALAGVIYQTIQDTSFVQQPVPAGG
jgi:hypothetical protein